MEAVGDSVAVSPSVEGDRAIGEGAGVDGTAAPSFRARGFSLSGVAEPADGDDGKGGDFFSSSLQPDSCRVQETQTTA